MLVNPPSDALGERIVIECIAELGDWAVYFQDFVDGAGVVGALWADKPDVKGEDLGVFEPGVEEEVAASHSEGCGMFRSS